MFNIGSVVAKITADTKDFKDKMREAKGSMGDFSGSVQKTGSGLMKFAGVIATVAGAVGLGALAKSSVDAAAKMEQTRVSFETMTGSAEKATALISDLTEFANKTPFENFDVTDAAKSLMSYGVAAEDIQSTLKNIGDVAAGVNVPIKDMASLFGKMRSSGVIFTEDLNQMADRGIPIFKTLEKQFGKTTLEIRDMASKAEISFDDIEKAFKTMTNTGEPFLEALDGMNEGIGKIDANAFEEFLPPVKEVIKALSSSGDDVDEFFSMLEQGGYKTEDVKSGLDELGLTTTDLFQAFDDGANNFGMFADMMENQSETVTGKISTITGKFQNLLVIVGEKLFPIIKPVLDRVIELIDGVTAAIGSGGGDGMTGAFQNLLPIFQQVKEALMLFFEKFKENFEQVKTFLQELGLGEWFQQLFQSIVDILTQLSIFWSEWGDEITGTVLFAFDIVISTIKTAVDTVMGLIKGFLQIINGDWKGGFETLYNTAKGLIDKVLDIFNKLFEKVKEIFGKIKEKVSEALNMQDAADKVAKDVAAGMDMDKKQSPSINDRLRMLKEGMGSIFEDFEVPDISSQIAQSLSVPAAISGNTQNININTGDINNGIDVQSLAREIALETQIMPGVK